MEVKFIIRRTPPASVADPLELVELRILELLALASRIVFTISVGTVTTIALLFLLVSTTLIFEELLFVKLLGFLGLLVFVVFDVVRIFLINGAVRIFLKTTRAALVFLVAHAVLVTADRTTTDLFGNGWKDTASEIGDNRRHASFLHVVDPVAYALTHSSADLSGGVLDELLDALYALTVGVRRDRRRQA